MTTVPPDPAMPLVPAVPPADRLRIEITYCTQCRWLLRASWLASELLTSFGTEIGEVALRPGTGGVFRVRVGEEVVWDRETNGGFPDLGPLKRMVRDRVAPGRSLGHTDRAAASPPQSADDSLDPSPPEPSAMGDSSADLTGS